MDQLGSLLMFGAVAVLISLPVSAQQNTPPQPRMSVPSSVDKLKARATPVLVIPEEDIFKGINLTDTQKLALTSNLRSAPFKAFEYKRSIDAKDLAAQRLPSGELFQILPGAFAPTMMQQTLPGLGLPSDPCMVTDHTADELTALQKVLAAQLVATGGDVTGFMANVPKDCRRKQLIYFLKSAILIAK
jgi:hypothetical protein